MTKRSGPNDDGHYYVKDVKETAGRRAGAKPSARRSPPETNSARLQGDNAEHPSELLAALPVPVDSSTSAAHAIEENLRRLVLGVANARAAVQGMHTELESERNRAKKECAARHRTELEALEAAGHKVLGAIANVFETRSVILAPGTASEPWDAPCWSDLRAPQDEQTRFIRLGDLTFPGSGSGGNGKHPFLVPLLDHRGVFVGTEPDETEHALDLIRSVVLRIFAATPPGRCELTVFDPRIRGTFGQFSILRSKAPDLMRETVTSAEEFQRVLETCTSAVRRVADQLGRVGVENLGALHQKVEHFAEPYRVLVLLDFPRGIDADAFSSLVTLAEVGGARGTSLIVQCDGSGTPEHGVEPNRVLDSLLEIRHMSSERWEVRELNVEFQATRPPPRAKVEHVCSMLAKRSRATAGPTYDFSNVAPVDGGHWTESSTDGLAIEIGRAGMTPAEFHLRGADPALPNALIGGAVGQGKSNLLLVIIHAIAHLYGPDEVEFFLLDYKEGVEFANLGPGPSSTGWLPHVRVLGIESDREFGIAVLDYLRGEFDRRSEVFKRTDSRNIEGYRTAFPRERMPRIVLIVDEFQVLLEGTDERAVEAVDLLETLARKGRGYGIHVILSSQTLSGIQSLRAKEDSIFGQFPWRVALKTSATDSEALLGFGNKAASKLRYRGQAVLNQDFGNEDANNLILVAKTDDAHLADLREALWRKTRGKVDQPRVFYGARPAQLGETPGWSDLISGHYDSQEAPCAWVGIPVSVDSRAESFRFDENPGRTLAIVGNGVDEGRGIINSANLSLAAQSPDANTEFHLFDFFQTGEALTPTAEALQESIQNRGFSFSVKPRDAAAEGVFKLKERLDARLTETGPGKAPIYISFLGLQRARFWDLDDSERFLSPVDAVREIIKKGPLARMFVIGWWANFQSFSEQMGFQLQDTVQGIVFLKAPQSDVQSICGSFTKWRPQPNRGLYWDRSHMERPVTIVPFAITDNLEPLPTAARNEV